MLLVNAIFDGLNLVAKEAPLVNERDGVLILSENAGAHAELGEWALTVNPFDVAGQAQAIHEALTMAVGRAAQAARGDPRARARARRRGVDRRAARRRGRPPRWHRRAARIVRRELSHVDESGDVRMVDVGDKPMSRRRAVASATVRMEAETARRLGSLPKGDALVTAAARRDHGREADERADPALPSAAAHARRRLARGRRRTVSRSRPTAETTAQTGVEMEALTAASVAALTVYDMAKAIDKESMVIAEVRLVEKTKQ